MAKTTGKGETTTTYTTNKQKRPFLLLAWLAACCLLVLLSTVMISSSIASVSAITTIGRRYVNVPQLHHAPVVQVQVVPRPSKRFGNRSFAVTAAAAYLFATSFLVDGWYKYKSSCNDPLGLTVTVTVATTTAEIKTTSGFSNVSSRKERRRTTTSAKINSFYNKYLYHPFPYFSIPIVAVSSFPISSSLYKQHLPTRTTTTTTTYRSDNNNLFFSSKKGLATTSETARAKEIECSTKRDDRGISSPSSPSCENIRQSTNQPTSQSQRTFTTEADFYFQKHGKIPQPKSMHVSIEQLMGDDIRLSGFGTTTTTTKSHSQSNNNINNDHNENNENNDNILIIGDVHGCLNELKNLIHHAVVHHNGGKLFRCVVLVGDLCNKGPDSAGVIQFVRQQRHYYTVRGNHDDGALGAALGDINQCHKKKYAWIFFRDGDGACDGASSTSTLSDEDIEWMSNIPYTITIPTSFWSKNEESDSDSDSDRGATSETECKTEDIIIVHAGLIPDTPLEQQEIRTMVTIRYVQEKVIDDNTKTYTYFENHTIGDDGDGIVTPQLWAKAWNGPQLVIFGHDAKRGLQSEKYAIGLDTGATYGKQLSGIILPKKSIVCVDSEKVHCPIAKN